MNRVSTFAAPHLTFAQAVTAANNIGTTYNGAATNKSSLSACVDLFFLAGASRGKDITAQFTAAYHEDRETALRILLWLRDARGGAGERQQFRTLWKHLYTINPQDAYSILAKVPELGRWDDVLEAPGDIINFSYMLVSHALADGDRLAAKWMPRNGEHARALRAYLGLTPKAYRKLLVSLSDTVEQRMCAKQWDEINFAHVPSIAAARYQKAFNRNAAEAYQRYKDSLVKGEAKINAGAIFPHDVLKGRDPVVREAQWDALPNYLGDEGTILPLVDVSGSMTCPVGGAQNLQCMDVSVALGLYLADKQRGPFQNLILTFESHPKFVQLSGSLAQKEQQVRHAPWGGSTNVEAAFHAILAAAKRGNVRPEDMPRKLMILSDMEFNPLQGGTALDTANAAFAQAGYELPQIIWWNLNARPGNCPATVRDDGTALVSGYSPSILKAILAGKTITPVSVMMEAVGSDRYKLD